MNSSEKERRNFFRHPIRVPLKLRLAQNKTNAQSESRDLSLGGLNFSWPKKIAKGTLLEISIPVKDKLFELRGKVVYSREDRQSARFHTGVSFVDFPSAFKARLAEEVLEILEFQKKMSMDLGHEITEEEAASKWIREFASHFPNII